MSQEASAARAALGLEEIATESRAGEERIAALRAGRFGGAGSEPSN
jgi:hypothetical protein